MPRICIVQGVKKVKLKVNVTLEHAMTAQGKELMCSFNLSLTSALDGGGWSTPRPDLFIPRKDPVTIALGAGWDPGPVWTGAENLSPTGIRSLDRPARNKSLCRLSNLSQRTLYREYKVHLKN